MKVWNAPVPDSALLEFRFSILSGYFEAATVLLAAGAIFTQQRLRAEFGFRMSMLVAQGLEFRGLGFTGLGA